MAGKPPKKRRPNENDQTGFWSGGVAAPPKSCRASPFPVHGKNFQFLPETPRPQTVSTFQRFNVSTPFNRPPVAHPIHHWLHGRSEFQKTRAAERERLHDRSPACSNRQNGGR